MMIQQEARLAIEYIVIPGGGPGELLPRRADIIARQLELVESYHLAAENSGTELNPRLQILPSKSKKMMTSSKPKDDSSQYDAASSNHQKSQRGKAATTVSDCPSLPE